MFGAPEGVRTEATNPFIDRLAPFAGWLGSDPVGDARAEATELPLDGQGAGLLGWVFAEQQSDLIHVVRYARVGSGEFDVAFEPLLALGISLDRLPVPLPASACRARVRLAHRPGGGSVGPAVRMSTVGSRRTFG